MPYPTIKQIAPIFAYKGRKYGFPDKKEAEPANNSMNATTITIALLSSFFIVWNDYQFYFVTIGKRLI